MDAAQLERFESLPKASSCRLTDFQRAEVRPGVVTGTRILVVSGTKPWANMEVSLSPLVYIKQPEYWGIEVTGCLAGIGLPVESPYTVALQIEGTMGTRGIEVIGASRTERIDLADGNSA